MNEHTALLDRRKILQALTAGVGVATMSTTLPATQTVLAKSDQEMRKARYRDTQHVKTFYRVNRYPS